jgi:tyrosine-protein phosphatase YwqE
MAGALGPEPKKLAHGFLERRLAHFVASDSHGAARRRPLLARADGARRFGEVTAQLLFVDNPGAALDSAPLRSMTSACSSHLVDALN